MDKKKIPSKFNRQNMRSSGEQQMQMALAQNLGIPSEFLDPAMLGYSPGLFTPGLDAQQFLNPMSAAAAGYPFMNPATLQAFAGTGLGSMAGQTPEAAEWWNLAQNQALAASLGVGFYPGMIPPGFPGLGADAMNNKKLGSKESSRSSDHSQASNSRFSPHKSSPGLGSSGFSSNRIHNSSRKRSNDSHQSSSKERPDSRHSLNSPFHSSQVQRNSPLAKQSSSLMDSQQSQKVNERVFQDEFMRQLEQQLLLQQLQQQQQQQQEQLSATLQSVMSSNANHTPGTSASSSSYKKNTLAAEKMQQQLSQVIFQQLLQAGGAGRSSVSGNCNSNAAASSFLSSPSALEAMMAMNQWGNTNALSDLKELSSKTKDHSLHQTEKAHSSSLSNNRTNQKILPSSKSLSTRKLHSPSHKSRTHPSELDFASTFPGFSVPELPPDTAMLAALYSQQLQQQQQYESMMKEVDTANRSSRVNESKPSFSVATSSKSRSNGKHDLHYPDQRQHHEFTIPSSHNRSSIHSPANSTSSRGKSHTSPHRDSSHSPARKSRVPERSQSRGSSGSAGRLESPSMSKGLKRGQEYGQDVSDTLKLFSALTSKPNLSQEELATLLSLPPGSDPSSLFAGMNAFGAPFTQPGSNDNAAMDKFNLAAMFAMETRRIEEQLKLQKMKLEKSFEIKKESNLKDEKQRDSFSHRVSVIHENNNLVDSSDWPSSSHSLFHKDFRKHSKYNSAENKLKNGDIASSDGESNSENSSDYKTPSVDSRNLLPGKQSRKRRRTITGEDEVTEPLKHGWKREVRFKTFGNHLHGEVIYITPQGKKLRTFLEVDKHLEDNKISALHRNNFSFSSKVRIGSFFEHRDGDSNEWYKITDEEIDQKLDQFKRSRTPTSSCPENSDAAEQNEIFGNDSSLEKQNRKDNKEKQKAAKAAGQEREHQRQQMKILQQQEKLQKMEQQRMEKEIRERLAFEELERQRMAEALDRDQRRQQLLLMRALESRKRAEERERRREEIRVEKMMQRERKMEQRRIAMQIARELKMPVDDMSTIGAPELPELTSLQGTLENKCPYQLSGNATADILMVIEFVTTFKDSIHIDGSAIPTLEQLQLGLLNDPLHTDTIVKLTTSLLHQCLCDPGVPAPGPWLHCLTGVKVIDIDVKENNFSEILRLFIWARSGYKTEIAVRLETIPFLSLTTDEKAQSLAFLVNELVCSRPICNEIERNLDALATLRRDKWMVEGQMRQLRVAHERNCSADLLNKNTDTDENSNSSSPKKSFPRNPGVAICETGPVDGQPQQEDSPESLFHKKMEELTQQHLSFNTRLGDNSKPLRALDLGQDRFKRRYWVLPNLGGVYIEGLESGISYEDDDESPDEEEEEEEVEQDEDIKMEKEEKSDVQELEKDGRIEMDEKDTSRDNGEEVERLEDDAQENNLVKKEDGIRDVDHDENMVLCDESGDLKAVSVDEEDAVLDFPVEDKELDQSATDSSITELNHVSEEDSQNQSGKAVNEDDLVIENNENYTVACFNDRTSLHLSSTTEEYKENFECLDNIVQDKGAVRDSLSPDDGKDLNSQIDQNLILPIDKTTVPENFHPCGNENALKIDGTSSISEDPKISVNQLETLSNAQTKNTSNTETQGTANSEPQLPTLSNDRICEAKEMETEKTTIGKVNSAFKPTGNAVKAEADVLRSGALQALKEHGENLQQKEEDDSVLVAAKAIAAKAVASSSHLLFPTTENDGSNSEELSSTKATLSSSDTMTTNSCSATQQSSLPIGSHTMNALKQIGMNPSSLTSEQREVLSHLDKSDAKSPVTSAVDNGDNQKEPWYSVILKKPCDDTTLERLPESPIEQVASPSKEEATERKNNDEEDLQMSKQLRKISSEQEMPMDLSCPSHNPNTTAKTSIPGSRSKDLVSSVPVAISSGPADIKVITVKQEPQLTPCNSQDDSPDSKPDLRDKFFVPISYNNNVKTDHNYRHNPYNQMISSCPSPNTLANYIVSSANSGYFQFPSLDGIQFPIRAPDTKEQPDPIPREMKRGWWRIESEAELRSLSEKLHLRGIREKQLHRNITKHFDLCTNSMADAKDASHQFAIITEKSQSPVEDKLSHVDEEKKMTRSSSQEKKDSDTFPFATDEDLAFKVERRILIQVEKLSDRCCEMAVVSSQWKNDNPKPSKHRTELKHVPLQGLRDDMGVEVKFDLTNPIQHSPVSALGVAVDLLGRLERAVCRRYLKPPLVRKGGATEFSSLPSLSESGAMDVAAGLRTWRNAIASCTSAAQLSLCVRMLESCIAWTRSVKSPMKPEIALTGKQPKKRKNEKRPPNKIPNGIDGLTGPQKKRRKKKANPSKNQTGLTEKTSKSKKSRMPIDTADIISKSSSDGTAENENSTLQLVNGNMTDDSNLTNFDAFSPLSSSLENSTWSENCDDRTHENGINDFSKDMGNILSSPAEYLANSNNFPEEYKPNAEVKKKKKKKKSKKSKADSGKNDEEKKKISKGKKIKDKEAILCRTLLQELQSHEDATWFLFPVDCKAVPGYRKIIKKPIDFHTIECRIKKGRYKTRQEFVEEVRLVFDNCQKFNEDDSNIGRAGHRIREHFERRWQDLVAEKYGNVSSDSQPLDNIAEAETEAEPAELFPVPLSACRPEEQEFVMES